MWPDSTIVLSVRREGPSNNDICCVGDRVLSAGDTVIVKTKYSDEGQMKEIFKELLGGDYPLEKIEYKP